MTIARPLFLMLAIFALTPSYAFTQSWEVIDLQPGEVINPLPTEIVTDQYSALDAFSNSGGQDACISNSDIDMVGCGIVSNLSSCKRCCDSSYQLHMDFCFEFYYCSVVVSPSGSQLFCLSGAAACRAKAASCKASCYGDCDYLF